MAIGESMRIPFYGGCFVVSIDTTVAGRRPFEQPCRAVGKLSVKAGRPLGRMGDAVFERHSDVGVLLGGDVVGRRRDPAQVSLVVKVADDEAGDCSQEEANH